MAYADLDIFNVNSIGSLVGDPDANAKLHSSLSSPLTGEGSYCREFNLSSGTNARFMATVKTTYDGGSLVEIPDTKAISVRAWVRGSNIGASNNGVFIGAKMDPVNSFAGSANDAPYGYFLGIGDSNLSGTGDFLKLALYRRRTGDNSGNTSINITPTAGLFVDNEWYKIRMDVVPIGPVEDRIDVYTGTGATGSETWTLEHQQTAVNTDPYYIPWAQSGAGRVGFVGHCNGTTISHYIDRFQVFLTDV